MKLAIRKVENGFIVTSPDDEGLELVFNSLKRYGYSSEPSLCSFVESYFEDKPETTVVNIKGDSNAA